MIWPKSKSYMAVALLSAIAIVVVVYVMIRAHTRVNELTKQHFNEQQMMLARQVSLCIEDHVGILSRELRLIASQPSVRDMDAGRSWELFQTMYGNVNSQLVKDIALLDTSGTVMLSLSSLLAEGYDTHYEKYFEDAEALAKGEVVYARSRKDGGSLVLATPVISDKGELKGIVALTLRLRDYLSGLTSGDPYGNQVWALDGEGRFLYHPKYAPDTDMKALGDEGASLKSFLDAVRSEEQYRGRYKSAEGGHMIAASYPAMIGEKSWEIIVSAPVTAFQTVSQFTAHYILGLVLIGLAGLGAIAVVMSYNIELRMAHDDLEVSVQERTKELDRALKRETDERAKSEAILSAIGDGISIQDVELKVLYQNDVHKEIFGDHIGENCYSAYFGSDERCKDCALVHSLADGKIHTSEKKVKNGKKLKFFEITASPLRDSTGEIVAGIEVVRDITMRKFQEEELKKISNLESIGRLSVGIAHEINTPLTSALLKMQLMRDNVGDKLGSDVETVYFDPIERNIYKASNIAKELLQFAHPKTSNLVPINVNFIINSAFSLVDYKLNHIRVNKDMSDLPNLLADPTKLEQVFVNLLNNAIEAMPEGGEIYVKTRHEPNCIKIYLTDTGHGVPEEHADKVFEPFYTTKEVRKGTGLGLSICYGIIKQHGGKIRMEGSEQGTTVIMEFPLFSGEGHEQNPDS